MSVILIIVIILVVVLGWLWLTYNGLIRAKTRTDEAFSDTTVQMKRRFDLIPNIVETVKGYATHEKTVLEDVTKARTAAMSAPASDPAKLGAADNQLSGTLKSLFAVAENYPQLRAVESFTQLQEQLTATEDKIEFARRYYNTSARDYNVALQTFPGNLIAGVFSLKGFGFFEADGADRDVPQVSFSGAPAGGPPAAASGPPGASEASSPPAGGSPSGPPAA